MLVKSGTNTLQIDSDQPYSYYKVVASGTGTAVTVSGLDRNKDLIFARLTSPTQGGSLGTRYSPTNRIEFPSSADYYVLRPVSVTGASSATYGIRVYNVDGQVAFDSGHFGTGEDVILQITTIISPGAAYGQTGNSLSILYSGSDYKNVFCCVNHTSIITITQQTLGDFFYSSPTTSIRYNSYLYSAIPPGTYHYQNNPSSIVLAKIAIP